MRTYKLFTIGEWILVLAGVLLLVNIPITAATGSFFVWTIAKGVFAFGLVLFFFDV